MTHKRKGRGLYLTLQRNSFRAACLLLVSSLFGCHNSAPPSETARRAASSTVTVITNPDRSVVIKTTAAEFDVLPSGYVKAYLIQRGTRLTLDDPRAEPPSVSDYLVNADVVDHFALPTTAVSEAQGKLGPRGKRVE